MSWTIFPPKPSSYRYVMVTSLHFARRELPLLNWWKNSSFCRFQLGALIVWWQKYTYFMKQKKKSSKICKYCIIFLIHFFAYSSHSHSERAFLWPFSASKWRLSTLFISLFRCSQPDLLAVVPVGELVGAAVGAFERNVCICTVRYMVNELDEPLSSVSTCRNHCPYKQKQKVFHAETTCITRENKSFGSLKLFVSNVETFGIYLRNY